MKNGFLAGVVFATSTLFYGCGDSGRPAQFSAASDPLAVAGPSGGTPSIKVLSNRADLISGGDALIEVLLPAGSDPAAVKMSLNGSDVSGLFARRANGRYMGLLTGLVNGSNIIKATFPNDVSSSYDIVNHPSGGPIFAGPQPQPWVCQAGALDAQCNQAPVYTYLYMSTAVPDMLLPYDLANPAPDVVMTTTDEGVTVPFIVRVETGYIDRDQYTIKTLFQPELPWSPWSPQPQWNHKLLITHGSSCSSDHQTSTAPADETSPRATWIVAAGRGFAVMSTALDNAGHNCNIATQAESLVMAKERVIEQYGELRYTIGTGTSGGSLIQQQVANAYPGLYQGTIVTASFPDVWSSATQISDYHVVYDYFLDPSRWAPGVVWTPLQFAQVDGHVAAVNGIVADTTLFDGVLKPDRACAGVSATELYNAATNSGGVRCSLQDYMINVFGPREPSRWSTQEQSIARGFAGLPIDNVGVQYGLAALQKGQITPAQFIDLNQKIGGLTVDALPSSERHAADALALANGYRSGAINQLTNSNEIAILDGRGPDPGYIHDSYRAFAVRARLDRAHGTHASHVIWEGPVLDYGDLYFLENALEAMDRWLAAVEKDSRDSSLPEKIVANKPADITDRCYSGTNVKVADGLCPDAVVPIYGTPRTVAGDALTTDTNKCQLKPLDRKDNYGSTGFDEVQWTQLRSIFKNGVCDFSKPGVGQQVTVPWLTYQKKDGQVIYGGAALPARPTNSGQAWMSASFAGSRF